MGACTRPSINGDDCGTFCDIEGLSEEGKGWGWKGERGGGVAFRFYCILHSIKNVFWCIYGSGAAAGGCCGSMMPCRLNLRLYCCGDTCDVFAHPWCEHLSASEGGKRGVSANLVKVPPRASLGVFFLSPLAVFETAVFVLPSSSAAATGSVHTENMEQEKGHFQDLSVRTELASQKNALFYSPLACIRRFNWRRSIATAQAAACRRCACAVIGNSWHLVLCYGLRAFVVVGGGAFASLVTFLRPFHSGSCSSRVFFIC